MTHELFAFGYATLSVLFYTAWLSILFWFFGKNKIKAKVKAKNYLKKFIN